MVTLTVTKELLLVEDDDVVVVELVEVEDVVVDEVVDVVEEVEVLDVVDDVDETEEVLVVDVEIDVDVLVELLVVTPGPWNSSSLLLLLSASHRFPEASNDSPTGPLRPVWLVVPVLEKYPACPMTVSADIPEERWEENSSTLLLPLSDTHRLPDWSKATDSGR